MLEFAPLDSLLAAHRRWWQPAPFRDRQLPWQHSHGTLAAALEGLSPSDYRALRADDALAREWLAHWIPDIQQLNAFQEPDPAPLPDDFVEPAHVPGRKARQVSCFCQSLAPASGRLVEWCAGQGWLLEAILQRYPSQHGLGLEWQARLCQQGEARIRAHGLAVEFIHCDVMDPSQPAPLKPSDTVLALHACGHLHQRLIELARDIRPRSLHLSPCCYHLGKPVALSRMGRSAQLPAEQIDRHLAVQDITTGHSNRSKRNEKASAWRLGYDALRQSLLGDNRYRPLKSMPGRVWQGSFEEFVHLAADHHQIKLPANLDCQHWLAIGEAEHQRIRRLELPRRQYRRLLEWWLVLDAAQALAEQSYEVETGIFCPGDLTPRNLVIHARRNTR